MGARIQRAATQLLLLAVAFCLGFTPPAHAFHTAAVPGPAVQLKEEAAAGLPKTLYTGVFALGRESRTGFFCSDNPVNMVDPSGHEGDLVSTLAATSINSALTSMAIGAPFRAYKAAKQFEAGVALGDIAFDAATGIALDGAIGAALPGLFSIGSRIAPIARITQVGGQVFGRAANSVWNLTAIARGRMIEQTILGRLPSTLAAGVKNFPVIDDLYQGVATSIKSIDLLAKTYQNTATLVNKIVADAAKLAEFQGAALGKVTVTAGQIEERVLVVAVEEGAATTAQAEALVQAARQAQAAYPGVKVVVKAVP